MVVYNTDLLIFNKAVELLPKVIANNTSEIEVAK
jgi:hypothetical protein